ncbi:MAG: dipeptide epimerase [Chloroflexaceae bacterium]|nr:dipeptide epimerase [Chloroflexaceae bacterium]
MPTPTTIRSIAVETLDIPLNEPFGIAGGAQDVARNLLVTLELADGTLGYGEAAPFAAFNGETQEQARAAILAARATLEGADVREWRTIAATLVRTVSKADSARCALETAVIDGLTRQARMPLWAFFGGASTSLETDMTITTGSVEHAANAARGVLARGIRTIKIKIGSGDVALDVERVAAIHAVAPDSPLMLDGNCGFSGDSALELLAALQSRGITPVLFEQPVPKDDWAGLHQVSRWGHVPVATDETVRSSRSWR